MITLNDYIGSHKDTPTKEELENGVVLLARINALLVACGFKTTMVSGWRPRAYNDRQRELWIKSGGKEGANTAVNSKHITMQAGDLADNADQQIAKFLNENRQYLAEHKLWMEHPASTKGRFTNWCHVQSVAPKSGNLVFFP